MSRLAHPPPGKLGRKSGQPMKNPRLPQFQTGKWRSDRKGQMAWRGLNEVLSSKPHGDCCRSEWIRQSQDWEMLREGCEGLSGQENQHRHLVVERRGMGPCKDLISCLFGDEMCRWNVHHRLHSRMSQSFPRILLYLTAGVESLKSGGHNWTLEQSSHPSSTCNDCSLLILPTASWITWGA